MIFVGRKWPHLKIEEEELNSIDRFIIDLITDNHYGYLHMKLFIEEYTWSKYGDNKGWTKYRLIESIIKLIERFRTINRRGDYISPKQLEMIGRMMQCEKYVENEKNSCLH